MLCTLDLCIVNVYLRKNRDAILTIVTFEICVCVLLQQGNRDYENDDY